MTSSIESQLIELSKQLTLKKVNEAETRKKIIDKVLENILGWSDNDISYEERVSEDGKTTYSDYIVRTANTAFVVEAKRIGATFNITGLKKRTKLSGTIMDGEAGNAIRQAREYCRQKSIPFAVVTNGTQWLIFPGVRTDQVSFSDSNVIIFDSLERILGEELNHFKTLLSRDGVIEGNLSIELLGRNTDQFEERRLNNFFKNHNIKTSNPIYPLIENAVLMSFSDSIIDSDSDLLEKCYVKNADRTKFDNRIQMHLQKSQPLFSSQPKKPMRKKEQHALKDAICSSLKTQNH